LCLGQSRSSEEAAVATTKEIAGKLRLNCGQRGKITDLATETGWSNEGSEKQGELIQGGVLHPWLFAAINQRFLNLFLLKKWIFRADKSDY
jgi:hypothetical protein